MKHHLTSEIEKILFWQEKEKIKYMIKRGYIVEIYIEKLKTKEMMEIYLSNDEVSIDGEDLSAQMRAMDAFRYTVNTVIEFCKGDSL